MMSEFTMEVLKLTVMVTVMLVILVTKRYLIPLVKELIGEKKMEEIRKWAKEAVEAAQQLYKAEPGAERKKIVIDIMRGILLRKNIDMSDKELEVLIEAAVKAMKMKETGQEG